MDPDILTINQAKNRFKGQGFQMLKNVTGDKQEAQTFSLDKAENNQHLEEEYAQYKLQLFNEANFKEETPKAEDTGTLEAEFGSNSEANTFNDIVRSITTIKYHSAPPVIIVISIGKDNEITIYLNSLALFRDTEEFKLVRNLLESRTTKHKIDHIFYQSLAKTFNSSTITSVYTLNQALDSMYRGLPQWIYIITIATDEQAADIFYRNSVEYAIYFIH